MNTDLISLFTYFGYLKISRFSRISRILGFIPTPLIGKFRLTSVSVYATYFGKQVSREEFTCLKLS